MICHCQDAADRTLDGIDRKEPATAGFLLAAINLKSALLNLPWPRN